MNETTIPEEEIREAHNSANPDCAYTEASWYANRKNPNSYASQFAGGYLANVAKHAEEVAKKDANMEALRMTAQEFSAQITANDVEIERMKQREELFRVSNDRIKEDLESQLTAAREREERFVMTLRQIRGTPGNVHYHSDMVCDALDAYVSSRAADGKGNEIECPKCNGTKALDDCADVPVDCDICKATGRIDPKAAQEYVLKNAWIHSHAPKSASSGGKERA